VRITRRRPAYTSPAQTIVRWRADAAADTVIETRRAPKLLLSIDKARQMSRGDVRNRR
jgi:hypothetical protein